MSRFLAKKTLQQSLEYLIIICQEPNKSLRDYVHRFNATTITRKGVIDEWAIQVFIVGTTNKRLRYFIIRNTPNELSNLYEMVHKFSEGDEVEKVRANSSVPKALGMKFVPNYFDILLCI
ncbi:hypothetical protein J1N35_038038 [Gossypium stocksii]|uniref:Retrotransposon gag domain-containing protein n=1 Tax=Gossypium stocksii TaxID=47602 RepID=A0A9D3ZM93_9ROSI|nr:hypothetical protein J1N35_038038 [Gossypium stocksii]